METIEFKYQNVRMRVLSLVPLAVLWPLINYLLTEMAGLKKIEGVVISLIVLYVLMRCICRINGSLFTKDGYMNMNESQTSIKKGKEELTVANDDVLQLRAEKVSLFGRKIACFKIKYKEAEKEKIYHIYSDDLGYRNVQECSAWEVYAKLKKDIFGKA